MSAQPKGLGAGSLWVEGRIARPEGGFEPKPRGSEIDVDEAENCSLAVDVDGDSQVELVAVENDSILVFPLIRSPDSKVVVADPPRWRVDFHSIDGRLSATSLLGLPGDRLLVTGHTEGRRQVVRVLQFH